MHELTEEIATKYRNLSLLGFTASVILKSPLEHSILIRGLADLQREIPAFGAFQFDEKENRYLMASVPSTSEAEEVAFLFSISESRGFQYAWDPALIFDHTNHLKTLFDTLATVFPMPTMLIRKKPSINRPLRGSVTKQCR